MGKLVRGVIIFSIVGMFVAFIYAQATTERRPNIAKDSQTKTITGLIDSEVVIQNALVEDQKQDKDKNQKPDQLQDKKNPFIEKTVMSKEVGKRRGMFT